MTWVMSALRRWTWLICLANQALWAWFIVPREEWGLLAMNLAVTVVAVRNLWKWTRLEAR